MPLHSRLQDNNRPGTDPDNRDKRVQNRHLQTKDKGNQAAISSAGHSGNFSQGPALRDIITAAADITGVQPREIISPRRRVPAVLARQIVYKIAVEYTILSYPQIGRVLNRDHSTIIAGYRAFNRKCIAQPFLKGTLQAVLDRLGL